MTTTYERNMVLETGKYKVVGTRPIRHDGADKVTGRAKYGADFYTAGLLHGKILRSPHAHAIIKSIDTSRAEAHPGVKAVVTAQELKPAEAGTIVDLGESAVDVKYQRGNVLARDRALYKGHAVAAVAARSPHEAEEALSLIDVEYEVLPPVLTAVEGMQKDAPRLHEDLTTEEGGEKTDVRSNVVEHFQHKLGDFDKAIGQADVVVEREFNTATVHQGYIEPHNVTALWNADGRLTVWCSTQGAFTVRAALSACLDKPVSEIKVVPMEIGGGFGGKIPIYIEPVAALLSKLSRQAVKIVMTRQEVFEGTGPTPGSYIKVKMGATNEGKIIAAQAFMAYESGAFPGGVISAGAKCILAPYNIPNTVVDAYDVVVNKPKTAAYRAPGSTNAAFASESVVNELADRLGIDPIEFRLANAAKEGTRRSDGPVNPRIGCEQVLKAMKDHPHYQTPLEGPNRGRGVAAGFWFNAGLESSATISVNVDGTANLVSGSPDIGGTRTSLAMQAAEVLGIPAEHINPSVGDTDSIGYTAVTGGSRVTFATGLAAYRAAEDVKRQSIERAALVWEVDSESLEMENGVISSKPDPELSMSFKEVAGQMNDTGGPIMGRGSFDGKGEGGSYTGNIVDVEVDPETGKLEILRFTVFQDAGKAIHPSYVEGQMQGGSVQGIGWALNEEYFMDDTGKMTNSTLLDYRMPVSLDVPLIDTVIVEVPNPRHPLGVRGVGEASIAPPPAAIADAIYNATGVRMYSLPMNPAAVTQAVWQQKK